MTESVKATRKLPKESATQIDNDSIELGDFQAVECQLDQTPVELETYPIMKANKKLGVYKLTPTAVTPFYATDNSACFDLSADFSGVSTVTVYDNRNESTQRQVRAHLEVNNLQSIALNPGDRAMLPTNLIFDIPEGYKVAIYPRSGLSLKDGLNLANCEAVIDSDYVDPIYILLHNFSDVRQFICHGARVAQGELVEVEQFDFEELTEKPTQKTNRAGGLGHTGKGV